jgi:hypothetical protein
MSWSAAPSAAPDSGNLSTGRTTTTWEDRVLEGEELHVVVCIDEENFRLILITAY